MHRPSSSYWYVDWQHPWKRRIRLDKIMSTIAHPVAIISRTQTPQRASNTFPKWEQETDGRKGLFTWKKNGGEWARDKWWRMDFHLHSENWDLSLLMHSDWQVDRLSAPGNAKFNDNRHSKRRKQLPLALASLRHGQIWPFRNILAEKGCTGKPACNEGPYGVGRRAIFWVGPSKTPLTTRKIST